jgi:hypothetical protein
MKKKAKNRDLVQVKGHVLSNDGDKALVHHEDGVDKWFSRGTETAAEFLSLFPVGGEIVAQKAAYLINSREDLFQFFKGFFKKFFKRDFTPADFSIIAVSVSSPEGNAALIGQGIDLPGITVFCAPACEAPDGSAGKYFALMYPDGTAKWLEFKHKDFEYALT